LQKEINLRNFINKKGGVLPFFVSKVFLALLSPLPENATERFCMISDDTSGTGAAVAVATADGFNDCCGCAC